MRSTQTLMMQRGEDVKVVSASVAGFRCWVSFTSPNKLKKKKKVSVGINEARWGLETCLKLNLHEIVGVRELCYSERESWAFLAKTKYNVALKNMRDVKKGRMHTVASLQEVGHFVQYEWMGGTWSFCHPPPQKMCANLALVHWEPRTLIIQDFQENSLPFSVDKLLHLHNSREHFQSSAVILRGQLVKSP